MTIIAITPTLTNLSIMVPNKRISRICETNSQRAANIMIPINTFNERESRISR